MRDPARDRGDPNKTLPPPDSPGSSESTSAEELRRSTVSSRKAAKAGRRVQAQQVETWAPRTGDWEMINHKDG